MSLQGAQGLAARWAASLAPALVTVMIASPAARADDVADEDPSSVAASPAEPILQGEGVASWYGDRFHGRRTACGETFDQHAMTAAHRTLPFGTLIVVTNVETGCRVTLRVNDRGPYRGRRILDCSRAAAEELGFLEDGLTRVTWTVLGQEPDVEAPPPIEAELEAPCPEEPS